MVGAQPAGVDGPHHFRCGWRQRGRVAGRRDDLRAGRRLLGLGGRRVDGGWLSLRWRADRGAGDQRWLSVLAVALRIAGSTVVAGCVPAGPCRRAAGSARGAKRSRRPRIAVIPAQCQHDRVRRQRPEQGAGQVAAAFGWRNGGRQGG